MKLTRLLNMLLTLVLLMSNVPTVLIDEPAQTPDGATATAIRVGDVQNYINQGLKCIHYENTWHIETVHN
jgi:hypothetical protein